MVQIQINGTEFFDSVQADCVYSGETIKNGTIEDNGQ